MDEADPDILAGYLSRISSILKGSYNNKLQSLSSIEELTEQVERLTKENDSLKHQVLELDRFQGINDFTRSVLLDKVAAIVEGSSAAEIKEFIDYLEIFEKYEDQLHFRRPRDTKDLTRLIKTAEEVGLECILNPRQNTIPFPSPLRAILTALHSKWSERRWSIPSLRRKSM